MTTEEQAPVAAVPAQQQKKSFADLLKQNTSAMNSLKLSHPVMSIPAPESISSTSEKKKDSKAAKSKNASKNNASKSASGDETVTQKTQAIDVVATVATLPTPPSSESASVAGEVDVKRLSVTAVVPSVNVWELRKQSMSASKSTSASQSAADDDRSEEVVDETKSDVPPTGVTSPSALSVASERPHTHGSRFNKHSHSNSPSPAGRGRGRGGRRQYGTRSQNRHSTGSSQPAHYYTVDYEMVKSYLLAQIEYYFSTENLCRDLYFRTQMDDEGYIPLSVIAAFNRVKTWTTDVNFLKEVS